ncbi:DEAD/DEAH box helicase, partial [bacterium]|nr:DEAD/DEAH box helicase [bacterium]
KVTVILNVGEQEFAYNPFTRDLFRLGETLLHFFRGFTDEAQKSLDKVEKRPEKSIFTMLYNLASYWLTGRIEDGERQKLLQLQRHAEENNFPWIALESSSLLALSSSNPESEPPLPSQEPQLRTLSPAINFEPAWRRTLNAIRQVTPNQKQPTPAAAPNSGSRLAWFLLETQEHFIQFTPKIQRLNQDNTWSNGRNLAFDRIRNGDKLPCFTKQDRRICQAIRETYNGDEKSEKLLDQGKILKELVGHPHLFRNDRTQLPVVLSSGEVAVIINKVSGAEPSFSIRLDPDLKERDCIVISQSQSRLIFYRNNEDLRNIARLLGREGLTLPLEAQDDIITTLKDLAATLPIFSDIDPGLDHDHAKQGNLDDSEIEFDQSALYLQIFPSTDGLLFELKVKPLGPNGPILTPATGPLHLITTIAGETCSVKRDLNLELDRTRKLLATCTAFSDSHLNFNWQIDNLEECLDTLAEIQDFQNNPNSDEANWLTCEWPAGKKISLKKRVQGSAFKFRVESRQDWFKIEGELQVDENEVISLKELLKQSKPGPGNFLKLADGEFISLSKQLRERLLELSLYLQEDESEGELIVHRGAMGGVARAKENFDQVKFDKLWQQQMERFQEAENFSPVLPKNLKTELRSYQVEGFNWLARLAYLRFGACLADDMGLGKTVQTLTLILTRATAGPTLVVAPTSVCGNWLKESLRFAPDLNPIFFGGPEREEIIANIKPFDLLICSYTMLQQEQKLIAGQEWEIIVLDEAQAIKNMNTKRSQAAMSLNGKFRLITTGTPMENHLGELWNLFNFINPGLLGSLKQFTQRFALPIEHENNRDARDHLRKLIKPYILRRNKSQVLKELPERTEILLEVKMSDAERNFYEAVRQQAIDRLEEASDKKTGAAGPSIQVLAELTRLRLAACNPRLVRPDSTIESAKLELFGRIIDDLLEGNHQALVFSQFVKHLNLVREYLDKKKISYRYLDGSTPKAKREDEINAFQEGQADLFLISLKAGGLGLNLTAADYVLHLDPWWNPAIEDQASDRAHRIGQTRPVTVYRLITKASIEEKIVRLHQEKRNLAD